MKILVNASTSIFGGGIQAAVSFVEFICQRKFDNFEFMVAVSRPVYENLSRELRISNRILVFGMSPASPLKGRKTRLRLKQIEREFKPDIVYSISFPSYVRFDQPEIGRYTNPWEINSTRLAWSLLTPKEKIVRWLRTQYRLFWARKADYFETQTEVAKLGIIRLFRVKDDSIHVIPNVPNPIFISHVNEYKNHWLWNHVMVFCLAAAYRHKNLGIIPRVARTLVIQQPGMTISFILTLPPESILWTEIDRDSHKLGVERMIRNIGPLKLHECVSWYQKSHIVFLPTVLEVFSATYVEAMAMQKPIVTSDLDFARETCGNAALYFNPNSAEDAAEAIISVICDPQLRKYIITQGLHQLQKFPDSGRKHQIVLDWLAGIAQSTNGKSSRQLRIERFWS